MLTEGTESELLEKVKVEETAYNWAEAAKLYEQLAEFSLDRSMVKEAAEIYKKLGYTNIRAAETSKNEKIYIEFSNNAITAYREAAKIFKQMEKNAEVSECEAEVLYASGIISGSIIEAKKAWNKALELFNTSYESYSNENDDESCARALSRVLMILVCLGWNCIDSKEFQQIFQKGGTIAKKAWKISKDIDNIQYLAESLYAEVSIIFIETFFMNIKADENWKKNFEEIGLRCNEILTLGENCNDLRINAMIYSAIGEWYAIMGFYFIDGEIEQREYFIKGVRFLEKSIECARKTNDKAMIITSIMPIDIYSYASPGMQSYFTKRVYNDLQTFNRYIKRFGSLINPSNMLAKVFIVGAYSHGALADTLSHKQRSFFAMESINYSMKFLKDLHSPFLALWANYSLTESYSALTNLAASKEKQVEYADKTFYYAKQAEDLAKDFEEGWLALNSLDGSFLAYKSFANIAESDDKKIKMLNLAIDAIEKKLKLNTDSRCYIFGDQIRQATLYEELGVLTKSTDTLKKANELFSGVIKRSLKWGYYFFGAIACDYIAHIEDRLGNYNTSAENYEKTQNFYSKMLKTFTGYKRGINFVKEKLLYVRAWNLIEKAKAYHKRENHIKAKECYGNASEILNNVSRYNYEAPYYAAWSLLEEAEQISKQDRQEDAIERYKATRSAFEKTIEILANVFKETKEKSEGEKIEKLKKVAKLRMNYCSARIDLEKARILGKQGEHLEAAEKFASAASQFRHVCTRYKIERERKELEAVYYLCRAWESMELAEKYEEPDRFTEAVNLFAKASDLFTDSKLKLLSLGNSAFCQALEYGCKFDASLEMETKSQLYTEVKSLLRKAADLYRKGGFDSGADWALATSTYFDATWHLIRADKELDINKKGDILGIGSRYLKSAAELFSNAGHKDKVIDVQKQLEMVEREELIILSALNTVKRPAISSSTMGILAPACPIETSQPPRMSEIQQIEAGSKSILLEGLGDSLEVYECDTNLNILHISDIQEGRFGIKEDISEVSESYVNFLSDLKDKLEILHRKNKIDIIVISGDLTSIGSKEEFDHLTNEFLPILSEVFLKGTNTVPKNRWIIVPGNHDVEWDKEDARFNNFIQFSQENGFHQYKLNNPESIYSRIICRDKSTGNTLGIIALNSCLEIFDENSPNISNISNSYFSSFSKDWDEYFRKMPKLMVCHHTLHSIKKDRFNHALNKLSDNNVLLALAGDIHKSDSHADEISNIRCIPAGTILAKKTERQVGIDEVSRQFNLINLNLQSGYVKWYTYSFEGTWREIKNQSFYLEHDAFSKEV